MAHLAENLIGRKFGRLTVIERAENYKNGSTRWLCRCECGKELILLRSSIVSGHTKSCGCYSRDYHRETRYKHGGVNTRLYSIYKNVKARCYQPTARHYDCYGGRGISVCDEWLEENGFENFKTWALGNGYADNLTLDRIDPNGNYEPSNCRWITRKEQGNNRRNTIYIVINGNTKPLAIWCDEYGIDKGTAYGRYKRGWKPEDIFTKPIQAHERRNKK